MGYMRKSFPSLWVGISNFEIKCETCIQSKSHRNSYPSIYYKNLEFGDLIHSDGWGPAPVNSVDGERWFVLFTDDSTRMTWLYLLKNKSEAANCFLDFSNLIQRQFGKKIKILRSDNGGEYVNNFLGSFFKSNGIIHETSCVGTPQQNGVAERKNRHILEIARSLLFENNVSQNF